MGAHQRKGVGIMGFLRGCGAFFHGLMRLIVGLCLAVMSLVVFIQVILRWFFSTTWLPLEDLVIYSFSISTFAGAALLFREGGHIAITFFTDRLTGRWRRIAHWITQATIAIFVVYMLVYGWEFTVEGMAQFSPLLRIPLGIVYVVVPVSALATLVFLLENALLADALQKEGKIGGAAD